MNEDTNKIPFHKTNSFKIGTKIAEIILASLLITATASAAFASDITPSNIQGLINNERTYRGLKPLNTSPQLVVAATDKAKDMVLRNYFEHFAFGLAPWDFIIKSGYNYLYAGENLAMDFDTSEGMVAAWMKSPAHRKNILNPDFEDSGIGVVKGTYTDSSGTRETAMVSNMFGRKKPIVLQFLDRVIERFSNIF